MRIDPRLLNWGLFFILLGAIPLAVRQGILAPSSIDQWWSLWPLLLVGAGVGLLARRTPFEFAGGLLTAATLGVMGGSLLAGGFSFPLVGCGDDRGTTAFETRQGELTEGASVRIELNCGELDLDSGGGGTWHVEGADQDGEGPLIDASADRLVVRSMDESAPIDFLRKRDRWSVTIPGTIGLDVDLSINAGRGSADLGDGTYGRVSVGLNAGEMLVDVSDVATLRELDVEVNAGSASVSLPNASFSADLSVNAGTISFCAPADVGLRIRVNDNITAGNNFADRGLVENGSLWETPNYASASSRIEVDAEANAGSVNLNPDGGCDA